MSFVLNFHAIVIAPMNLACYCCAMHLGCNYHTLSFVRSCLSRYLVHAYHSHRRYLFGPKSHPAQYCSSFPIECQSHHPIVCWVFHVHVYWDFHDNAILVPSLVHMYCFACHGLFRPKRHPVFFCSTSLLDSQSPPNSCLVDHVHQHCQKVNLSPFLCRGGYCFCFLVFGSHSLQQTLRHNFFEKNRVVPMCAASFGLGK
mmetsp:Transcript_13224/g.19251  ORF Transcript_13224/g.19251 Transcript_13224/m.19251 type:complete len:200 (-) Transcript_13224:184-783(-)